MVVQSGHLEGKTLGCHCRHRQWRTAAVLDSRSRTGRGCNGRSLRRSGDRAVVESIPPAHYRDSDAIRSSRLVVSIASATSLLCCVFSSSTSSAAWPPRLSPHESGFRSIVAGVTDAMLAAQIGAKRRFVAVGLDRTSNRIKPVKQGHSGWHASQGQWGHPRSWGRSGRDALMSQMRQCISLT
jgi:hypothetical protein